MDATQLAQIVAAFLAPFLPYLLKAGEKAAEEAGKKIGGDTWEQAKALWGRLRPKVESKPAAREAMQDAASAPKNANAQAAWNWQLEKLLATDSSLATEVAKMVAEAKAAGGTIVIASGERAFATGESVIDSTITTGDVGTAQAKVDKRKGKVFVDGTVHGDAIGGNQTKREKKRQPE